MSTSSGFGNGFNYSLGNDGFDSGFASTLTIGRIVETGLVMHFDVGAGSYPGSGSTLYDLSTAGRNATLYNSPTFIGTNGGVIRYSKNSFQYAEAPNPGDMLLWTAETWIKFNESPSGLTQAIVTGVFDLVSKLNFTLGTQAGDADIRAGFYDTAWRTASPGMTITVGAWKHILGTYDGSVVRTFVNGNQIGTLNYIGTPASGGNIRIARRWDDSAINTANFISADIPVVRVYNRALTQTEIWNNFNVHRRRYSV